MSGLPSPEVLASYRRELKLVEANDRGFRVFPMMLFEAGPHPQTFEDYECEFASSNIRSLKPSSILDIGSYRRWIIGLLTSSRVVTVDVRDRKPVSPNETVVTSDAKHLKFPDGTFDMVTSLCALEHFGLGRYGDQFDLDADRTAFSEMVRVLRPGGHLVFTTTLTRGEATICFNAHRIYNFAMLRSFCADLDCEQERFYSHTLGDFCSFEEVTRDPNRWDVYLGCWRKK